jgi:hypothetical protein
MAGSRVFVDTNVLLAAFPAGAWSRFAGAYRVETVEKCLEETQTGDPLTPGRVNIPLGELKGGLAAIHALSKNDLASFVLKYPKLQTLDDGERHLLAWLLAHEKPSPNVLWVTTADKAAIVACGALNWLDAVVSFEKLLRDCGTPHEALARLGVQYKEAWLCEVRTKVRLGVIP